MSSDKSATEGMIDYSDNSSPQRHSIQSRAQAVREMADKVSPAGDEIHIADYGCGTGANAVLSVRPAIESCVVRFSGREIFVHHVDQAENDWNTLFHTAHGPRGYMDLAPSIRPVASVGSFFDPSAPSGTIDIATSFGASHWLSQQPIIKSPGTLWFADTRGDARAYLNELAQKDWERFLMLRLNEMRKGGRLMVSTLGAVPDPDEANGLCVSGRHTYRALYEVAQSMAEDGLLAQETLDRFVMPLWFLSRDEAQEPFMRNPALAAGFAIERLEVSEAPHTPGDIFAERIGTPDEYAKSYRGFVRSFAESTLRQALFTDGTSSARAAHLTEFFGRFERRIRDSAGKDAFEIWLLTVELRKL